MVYLVILDWCYDNGDTSTELLEICSTKEKAQACLKLNAEFDWAENWENLNLEKDELDNYEWTDDYYDVSYWDTRTTIYIVEKELK